MAGLDRYYSFGIRSEWIETYCAYDGNEDFWTSDGNGLVANKKKDAFRSFILDAGLAIFNKDVKGDKYTKCTPTIVARTIKKIGVMEDASWAIILCNLVYTPTYNWFVSNLKPGIAYTPDSLKMMLADVMENDSKGLGRRNVVDALRIVLAKTPIGTSHIFADCDYVEKISASGKETITMNSMVRCEWNRPIAEVILYSLYKFAEACGDYYQFTLETLLDDSIERDGVSPTRIFGLDRETMVRILNGLTVNYPEFITASFTLDLDTITLRPNGTSLTSEDVLKLF